MKGTHLPISLWVYIGLREDKERNSGHTYGLLEFNKFELEIIDSTKSLDDIRLFLLNMVHYILSGDVTFKQGQTCGYPDEEKIQISFSPGVLLEVETFKLGY